MEKISELELAKRHIADMQHEINILRVKVKELADLVPVETLMQYHESLKRSTKN